MVCKLCMCRTFRLSQLLMFVLVVMSSCSTAVENKTFCAGKYPGQSNAGIFDKKIVMSNDALKAEWALLGNSITLQKVTNRYDNETVDLNNIVLFAIETAEGKSLTNLDFQLQGNLQVYQLEATDSLPTKALRFSGKEVKGRFRAIDPALTIDWTAQLRDGSNYIRQNIVLSTKEKAVKIHRVTFFDGQLQGARYAGSVLGSPIEYKNFFFGLEHPIAHSKALMVRSIGSITQKQVDVSNIINGSGDYIISVEHGGGAANYNIEWVALLENKQQISVDEHLLNGTNGSSYYHLNVEDYDVSSNYQIRAEIDNVSDATGTFHIHRKTDDVLNFYVDRADELIPGQYISEWAVIGVTPENQNRRAFQYYLERERARPYKQFLHYNCWWDITDDGASSFTSEQLIERMHAWNKTFIEPYEIELNSFVFDDGWDDLDSVWYFDPVKFPNGFKPQADLCKNYKSGIGVWMSPFGGYLENQRRRVESAQREGLETNDKGLSLAGTNYYHRFLERSLDMLNNYKVNYFKFDGFGGSEPQYLPDMEAGARLIKTLRQHNPDVFVNITVGSWPSPFWLQYADCTWRGSGDLHLAGKGTRTQQFMTYRDGTLHNNIVRKAPYYPLNSIMSVGIAYANLGHPIKCINDSIDDFKDMVWSFFGAGSGLQELYISHDRMKAEFWPILAEAAKWAKENEKVLRDVHWIGGSPINLEVYGFASWNPEKGIITLRNPGEQTTTFEFTLNQVLEIPANYHGFYQVYNIVSEDQTHSQLKIGSGAKVSIELKPFETKILEVISL